MCSLIHKYFCYLLSRLPGATRRAAHLGPRFEAAKARGFSGDRSGVVIVLVALAMPVLLGLTAFAVDVSQWSSSKNSIQVAADNSALSLLVAAAQTGATSAQITNQALAVAAATGFTNGQKGVTVIVNNPPTSGPNTANTSAYEVIIKQPQTRYFAALLGAAPTVSGRAVVIVGTPACILALDKTASSAIGMSGGASVGAKNCTIAANSSSGTAGNFSGGASVTAANVNFVGNYTTSGGATITATVKTGAPATKDPYASLAVPSYSTSPCAAKPNLSGGAKATIGPGCYKGISVSGGAQLTMSSGNYTIDGTGGSGAIDVSLSGGSTVTMGAGIYTLYNGGFNLSGGNTITASGVSIILTGSPASSTGIVNVSGGADLTLTPPTSGPMQGVAFYVDRNAPANSNFFSGGTTMSITGSIYMPSQNVSYSGGSSTNPACLQLIADTVTLSGGSSFGVNCGSLVVPGLQQQAGTKGIPAE
ncbi:MAG: pilus assembly protein TadG-related protein [Methylocella sp.]